jgi:DNA-binding MarR family transcriptional regulator
MSDMPSRSTIAAWTRIVRASRHLMSAIEGDIKAAGLPPLAWYDVLLELSRAAEGRLTPGELEAKTLFAQYNLSRLLDRLEAEGLVVRVPYPGDRRRQLIEITGAGLALRKVMWPAYGAAIERRLGKALGEGDAERLVDVLDRVLTPRK